ncbi:MAG: hypothetical protein ABEJ61_00690 [Haloferacaceae archaeon]
MPSLYDHLRPVDADVADGVYRVVGTREAGVTLLRVADADGQRVHAGELVAVDEADLDGFAPAGNPNGNRSSARALASTVEVGAWSVRAFVRQLLARPLPTAVALALLAAGTVGQGRLPLPDVALGGLILAGSLGLAYVGSGRF